MRRVPFLLALCVASCTTSAREPDVRAGDIIFHSSRSAQSEAIQMATHSPYSHMGLILEDNGTLAVLEAAGRVKFTPLEEWIARGEGRRYRVKRLKDPSVLSEPGALARLERAARTFLGRSYDLYFEWTDERIYCSELVWKAYERGLGVRVGELASLESFDLSSEVVGAKIAERYGSHVPLTEPVISPAAMFDSPLLTSVQ